MKKERKRIKKKTYSNGPPLSVRADGDLCRLQRQAAAERTSLATYYAAAAARTKDGSARSMLVCGTPPWPRRAIGEPARRFVLLLSPQGSRVARTTETLEASPKRDSARRSPR
ncbi:hypothetical protein MTO96_004868 [Rhipicephalus appendiculatus]